MQIASLSVPENTIRFHVSNGTGAEVVPPSIVRVISADVNPAGPGIRTVAVDATVRPIAACEPQSVAPGSYALANLGARPRAAGIVDGRRHDLPDAHCRRGSPHPDRVLTDRRRVRTRGGQRRKRCVRRLPGAMASLVRISTGVALDRRRMGPRVDDVGRHSIDDHRGTAATRCAASRAVKRLVATSRDDGQMLCRGSVTS